jgi:hypothetical protein
VSSNPIYKSRLLSGLTEHQLSILPSLFSINPTLGKTLVERRLHRVLSLPYEVLSDVVLGQPRTYHRDSPPGLSQDSMSQYNVSDLKRIDDLLAYVDVERYGVVFLSRVILSRATKHNIASIMLHLTSPPSHVGWGPGNHNDITTNVLEHYKKHIVDNSDERQQWEKIIGHVPSLEEYRDYPRYDVLERVVVHSNGQWLYVSGFMPDGHIFVVCRYHNSTLGISSCYYVESGEKEGRYRDRCLI